MNRKKRDPREEFFILKNWFLSDASHNTKRIAFLFKQGHSAGVHGSPQANAFEKVHVSPRNVSCPEEGRKSIAGSYVREHASYTGRWHLGQIIEPDDPPGVLGTFRGKAELHGGKRILRRHFRHFAFGSNTGFGGKNSCPQHLDLVYLRPTIWLDGQLFMKDGALC